MAYEQLTFLPDTGMIESPTGRAVAYLDRLYCEKHPGIGKQLAAAPALLTACEAARSIVYDAVQEASYQHVKRIADVLAQLDAALKAARR